MKLEWDTDKEAINLRKHGITFNDAALVFHDQGVVSENGIYSTLRLWQRL